MTPAQKKVYDTLLQAEMDNKPTPTYRELCDAVGLKSKSGIHRIISALEEQGRITRVKNTKRSIKVNLNISDYQRGYNKGFDDAKSKYRGGVEIQND